MLVPNGVRYRGVPLYKQTIWKQMQQVESLYILKELKYVTSFSVSEYDFRNGHTYYGT